MANVLNKPGVGKENTALSKTFAVVMQKCANTYAASKQSLNGRYYGN